MVCRGADSYDCRLRHRLRGRPRLSRCTSGHMVHSERDRRATSDEPPVRDGLRLRLRHRRAVTAGERDEHLRLRRRNRDPRDRCRRCRHVRTRSEWFIDPLGGSRLRGRHGGQHRLHRDRLAGGKHARRGPRGWCVRAQVSPTRATEAPRSRSCSPSMAAGSRLRIRARDDRRGGRAGRHRGGERTSCSRSRPRA